MIRNSALVGVSGARRNACAAVCVDGQILAACEQERLTRVRHVGLMPQGLPAEAVEQVLTIAERKRDHVASYVVAERQVRLPAALPTTAIDHHQAHAATAWLTSPFVRAAVIVCDTNAEREVSVWTGETGTLHEHRVPWRGRGFARLYSECAGIFDLEGRGSPEPRLEALAHLGQDDAAGKVSDQLRRAFRYEDGSLWVESGWKTLVRDAIARERDTDYPRGIDTARAVQRRIGELFLDFLAEVKNAVGHDDLCVGGGFFYNTYITTLIHESGLFRRLFVPINPGNAGLGVGATLMLSERGGVSSSAVALSPFLGPAFDDEAVKLTLDSCKLPYSFVSESEALDAAVAALTRGNLVGWFQGRMEWGHRALGHRSILADPSSPYVLDNLNCFLRKRARWRPFGVSACAEAVPGLFCGPSSSPFMEFQYGVRDERLRHAMPRGATSLRVQTVTREMGPFWELHHRMEQATGSAALVNTSLNGFHEPIACTPRDAVAVFYSTGLDMLVMGRFILRK